MQARVADILQSLAHVCLSPYLHGDCRAKHTHVFPHPFFYVCRGKNPDINRLYLFCKTLALGGERRGWRVESKSCYHGKDPMERCLLTCVRSKSGCFKKKPFNMISKNKICCWSNFEICCKTYLKNMWRNAYFLRCIPKCFGIHNHFNKIIIIRMRYHVFEGTLPTSLPKRD